MLVGAVLHDLTAPVTNTSRDEISALQYCRSVAFRVVSKDQLLSDLPMLGEVDLLLCSSSFNPSRKRYKPELLEAIATYPGIKIITLQDEHGNVEAQREWIHLSKAAIVITMSQEPLLQKLYPPNEFAHARFVSALPGYVPERLENIAARPFEQRSIDISYRGRYQGFGTGALGQDKHRIGEILRDGLADSGLHLDIDPAGVRRITGTEWDSLLQGSKAALAVESGSSLIDWDGSLTQKIHRYHQRHPRATFEDINFEVLEGEDWRNIYTTASPRVFEYAANGCLLLLTEGQHSEIVQPWRHYVPIKRDGSNLGEVEGAVRNPVLWAELTANARKDLIDSGQYSWRVYAKKIDEALAYLGLRSNGFPASRFRWDASTLPTWAESQQPDSQTKTAQFRRRLRSVLPVSMRTRLWGVRVYLRRKLKSVRAWVQVGIPWLISHRSLALAREISTAWLIRAGAKNAGAFTPRFVITSGDSNGASGRFDGVLQVVSGFEIWDLSRRDFHHLPTMALERREILEAFELKLHPLGLDVQLPRDHQR